MSKIEKVISISLDDKSKTGLDKIEQTFKDVDSSIKKAEGTSVNLRRELKQLQNDLLAGKFTGEEFKQAEQRAGELKDTIADLSAKIKVLGSDTRTLDGLIGAAEGLAGGFAIAQGAAALLGGENKQLEETLLKVQSSLAILNGIQAVANVLQKESAASVLISTTAQNLYTLAVGESTGALRIFRLALAATGIGLLIIAIGELIANWDKLSQAIGGSTQKMKDLDSVSEATATSMESVYTNLFKVKTAFDEASKGAITKKEALKIYNDTLGDTLGKAKTLEEAEKIYKDKTPDYVQASFLRAQSIELINSAAKQAAENLTEKGQIKFTDYITNAMKQFKTLFQTNKVVEEVMSRNIPYLEKLRILGEMGDKKVAQAAKEREAEDKKTIDRKLKLAAELRAEADKLAAKAGINLNEVVTPKVEKKKDEKIKEPPIPGIEAISSQTEAELSAIDSANALKLEKQKKFNEDKIAQEQQFQLETAAIIYDSETARAERAEEQRQREIQSFKDKAEAISIVAQSGEDLLASIQANGLARGKAGQAAMKALALVQIAADSAVAFSKMMQGSESSAAGAASVAGPAAPAVYTATKIAFYASGTATILANIARARALLSSGNSSASAAGSNTVTAPAPQAQFNIVGQSPANRLADVMNRQQQQPVRAYVVGSDVTSQQSLDRNKINNSTFL